MFQFLEEVWDIIPVIMSAFCSPKKCSFVGTTPSFQKNSNETLFGMFFFLLHDLIEKRDKRATI